MEFSEKKSNMIMIVQIKKHKLSLLRNDGHLRNYFLESSNNKKILYLGTSESTLPYSIPYQLNTIMEINYTKINQGDGYRQYI